MLQTLSLASSVPWNDEAYSGGWILFAVITFALRVIMLFFFQKVYFRRPYAVALFTLGKFVCDYLMFEGVERFSVFNEINNMKIIMGIEVLYVVMYNYMIYSIFYGDFVLPSKAIIQFTAVNLASIGLSVTMLLELEERLLFLLMIIGVHLTAFLLYFDKCIGLLKCHLYSPKGQILIHFTVLICLIFNHFLRILYISDVLFNFLYGSVYVYKCLFLAQIGFSYSLIHFFIFYRCKNTDKLAKDLVVPKKSGGVEAMIEGFGPELLWEGVAEELMFPKDNDLNTVSDTSSVEDLEAVAETPEDVPEPPLSVRSCEVFKTEESGKIRRHIMHNKVASEDGTRSIRTLTP